MFCGTILKHIARRGRGIANRLITVADEWFESNSVLQYGNGDVGKLVTPADCKSAAPGTVCSTHTVSTILKHILGTIFTAGADEKETSVLQYGLLVKRL